MNVFSDAIVFVLTDADFPTLVILTEQIANK